MDGSPASVSNPQQLTRACIGFLTSTTAVTGLMLLLAAIP
jgi:hypothetical protein